MTIKVLHLAQFLKYGSAKGILALWAELRRRKCEIAALLAHPVNGFDHSLEMLAEASRLGVKLRFVDSTFQRNPWAMQAIQRMALKFRAEGYVFHTHGGFPALALSRIGLPYLHTLHGLGLNRPDWVNNQDAEGLQKAHLVLPISEDAALQCLDLGVPQERLRVSYYPLVPEQKKLSRQKVEHIGMVGALVPLKGHKYALEAFFRIEKLHPKLTFHIFGDGPLRQSLMDQVVALGLSGKVIFHGFAPHETIYTTLDLILIPSLKEGLGLVALEALENGVGVVAFKTGGLKEVIQDKVSGILVPAGSVDGLEKAVLHYLKEPALIDRYSRSGLSHCRTLFAPVRNTDLVISALEEMISNHI